VSKFFNEAEQAREDLQAASASVFSTNRSLENNKNHHHLTMMNQMRDKFEELRNNLPDKNKIMESFNALQENGMSGEFGTRGEGYVIAQFSLMAFIVVGTVPFLGDVLTVILGPGLLLSGITVMVLAVQDIGGALSPWPVTNERTELTTDGMYGQVRHPMYAGVLAAFAGYSLITGSAWRLLLTVALWYVLEEKSNYEEEQLQQAFPGTYQAYQKQVAGKFVPSDWSLLETMTRLLQNKETKP
jgi:protein-S-isoprenylcysteine O-methyltransferase Ste14